MTILPRTVLAVALGLASARVARAQSTSTEPPTVALSTLSEAAARAIQARLRELGFYRGEVDGVVGPETRRALRAFYRAQAELIREDKLLADSAASFASSRPEAQPVRGEKHPMERAPDVEPMRGVIPAQGASPTEGVNKLETAPPQPAPQAAPRHVQKPRDSTTVGPQVQPDPGPNATISPAPGATSSPRPSPRTR
jgi:peptidoglycan hydrolase-like protein with peptidoglycan-binding domain